MNCPAFTHFGFDDFAKFVANDLARPDTKDQQAMHVWREQYQTMLHELWEPALAAYFHDLFRAGLIKPIARSEGYENGFLIAWNAVARMRGEEHHVRDIIRFFAHPLIFHATYSPDETPDPGPDLVRERYEALLKRVERGTFSRYDLSDGDPCFRTGRRLHVHFENWQGSLFVSDSNYNRVPAPALPPEGVQSATLEVRGNELLAADWFRIEEFTKEVDLGLEGERLTYAWGRENITRHYAKLGFVSVPLGNCSPQLLQKDDLLVVGRVDDEMDNAYDDLGSVCTDLWAVTLIEKSRLIDIVARTLPRALAAAKVENYLQNEARDITRIEVTPGTYHLYFVGHYPRFGTLFKSPQVDLTGVPHPYFVLSRQALELENSDAT